MSEYSSCTNCGAKQFDVDLVKLQEDHYSSWLSEKNGRLHTEARLEESERRLISHYESATEYKMKLQKSEAEVEKLKFAIGLYEDDFVTLSREVKSLMKMLDKHGTI